MRSTSLRKAVLPFQHQDLYIFSPDKRLREPLPKTDSMCKG